MSNSKKVLYIEMDNRYPYIYTNSVSVCNLLNSKAGYTFEEDFNNPNTLEVMDFDNVRTNNETVYEFFNSHVKEILELIGCDIIWIESSDYNDKVFYSKVKEEHKLQVE